MLNQLLQLTKGHTTGNLEMFQYSYYCGIGIIQDLQLDELENFRFYDSGNELLLYSNNQVIYSCCTTEYCDTRFITKVYSNEGFVKEYSFEYESKHNLCLYDIWNTKQEESERWVYRLEPIYNKYGVDTVNVVREYAHLWSM